MDLVKYKELIYLDFSDKPILSNSCRNGDNFLRLKKIFSKVSDPNADSIIIKWSEICNISADILGNESKDLQVACYFCAGLMHELKFKGLLFGIEYLNYLLENLWENLYPPVNKINGRWLAIEWLIDQIEAYFDSVIGKKFYETAILKEQLQFFNKNILKFNDESKNVLLLIKKTDKFMPVVEEANVKPVSTDLTKKEGNTKNPGENIASINDAYEKLDMSIEVIEDVSLYLSSIKSTQEKDILENFRLLIQSTWQVIGQLPDSGNNGNTKINYPHESNVNQLNALINLENYDGIINICQNWIREYPYWFDLYKNIYDSMSKLDNYTAAAHLLKQETRAVIFRFPKLIDLKFSNGKKMISEPTLLWILEGLDNITSVVSPRQNTIEFEKHDSKFEKELKNICESSSDDKLSKFIKLNSDTKNICKAEEILLKISILEELLRQKRSLSVLQGYADSLLEDFDYFHISEWNPKLASKLLSIVIKTKNIIEDDTTELYKLLYKIDLKVAIKLT